MTATAPHFLERAPTLDAEAFYNSPEWRDVRERVKRRDRGRCTVSRLLGGDCSGLIHVHHIEALSACPDLRLVEDNLASVCATHHPTWERLRRELTREPMVPPCKHRHPYRIGAIQCENQRRRAVGLDPVEYVPEIDMGLAATG